MSGNIDRYGLEDVLHSFNALSDLCVTPCSNLKKKNVSAFIYFVLFLFSFTLGGFAAEIFLGITFHGCKRNEFHLTVFLYFLVLFWQASFQE